ncbi:MAG TPA: hypothetical protein VFS00_21955 [Polyangiaceae bacterium]|nr:hypothetical protein [Polyangiaceae bacterium]
MTRRTNTEAILHNQPNRPIPPTANQPPNQAPKAAARPATKARARSNAGRAPKKGAGAARPVPKGGDEGDGDGEPAPAGGESVALTSAHEIAYARRRPEIDAVSAAEVRAITMHVPAAAMLALGALPRMLALRDALAAEFAPPVLAALDALEDYALAAYYAYARARPRDGGETEVRALVNEAGPLRERLLASAGALVTFGLLDPKQLASVRRGTGHLDTATDLAALGLMHADAWPAIASKTPLERAEVARAIELGGLLLAALGRRHQGTDGAGDPAEVDEQLGKAYELFRRTYDRCRHAILYLRRDEGDGDDIAPPLARSRRRGRSAPVDEPEPGGDAPEEPSEPDGGKPDGEPDDVTTL